MARKAAENREEDILNAAIKIFSEKGYTRATTSEIAKEAGIAEGTIFRYFKNKKELLDRMLISSLKVISDTVIKDRVTKVIDENNEKTAKEILKAIVLDRIDLIDKNKEIYKVVLTELQYQSDLKEAIVQNIINVGKDILIKFVEDKVARGEFKNINVPIAVRNLVGMIIMYITQTSFLPELIPIDREKQVDEMVDLFLYGVSNKK